MARASSLALTPIAIETQFSAHESADHWSFQGQARDGEVIRRDTLPIPNLFLDNVVGALQALACLDLLPSDEVLRCALNDLGLGGRFEKRQDLISGRLVILDAAHNVAAAELLARRLRATFSVPETRLPIEVGRTPAIRLVLAAMADKNIEDIVRALDPLVDIWYIAAFEGSRAAGAQEIHTRVSTALPKAVIRPYDSVLSAYRAACNDQPDEHAIIVVTGSFHTLAEVAALSDPD
jgi:dihydrofolate synthase/folylpolyglutamate synthase